MSALVVGSLLEIGKNLISRVWPDPAKQAEELLKLKELEQKRDAYTTRIFWLMLEMVFIFGIPAVVAVYFAKKLSAHTEMNLSAIFIFISFLLQTILK